jgi:phosphonate transport system substrate-binding protein
MTRRLATTAAPAALLLGLTLAVGGAPAHADCPRGDLDERYCDVDGDLVADLPEDESEWLDPGTLVFAYTPVEDPAMYAEVWADFLGYLEVATGKPVQFFPIQSNAAQIEAMRAGRLHIAGISTGPTPVAVNCAGFRPFAIMGKDGRMMGYEMEIITYPGSGVESMEDLQGRTLAFTSPTSNSGFRAPSALLEAEFGMVADVDFDTTFSGAHDNSVLGVANRDYDAAAIANEVMFRMFDRGVVDPDEIVTIYTSATFPTTGYGMVYNLHPDLQEKIEQAFFGFDWEGTALLEEFGELANGFVPITYQDDWEIIRTIAAQVGDTFDCQ